MSNDGITSITLTGNGESVTVSPETFDRYAASLKRGGSMASATATVTRVAVPSEAAFGGEDFLPAPSLSAVLESLIQDYHETIGHLERVGVTVLWKAKGGKSKGKTKFGQCQKPSGLLSYFAQTDFVITISADHCRDAGFTEAQLRALVYHEVLHIGWEEGDEDGEDGRPILVGHDIETFHAEIRDMGAWHSMLSATADSFRQARLL